MKHLKYLSYILRHKWFVFLACCKQGIVWRGIIHDWSKFLPSELFPYMDYFYGTMKSDINKGRDETGYYKPTDTGDSKFDYAWLLHQKRNKHHWQWWILPEDGGGTKVFKIPEIYIKEMYCDWCGAGRAQGTPGVKKWYDKNGSKMKMHPESRKRIEELINEEEGS